MATPLGVGPDACVEGLVVVGQLPDQEDQGAKLVTEFAVIFMLLPGDVLHLLIERFGRSLIMGA